MEYAAHLSKDKQIKKLILDHGPFKLKKYKNICLRLCASIMSQQLSTKVAEVIYKRFIALFNGKEPGPEDILALTHEQLRGIGLSNSKVTYMQNVARFAIEKGLDHKMLNKMETEEVIDYLTGIKGVGRWTAEMILIFTLGREDVFSPGDFGIQQAMAGLYRIDASDKKKFTEKINKISSGWSPYRSYACLYLWRWKDDPAQKAAARSKKNTGKVEKK